MPEKPAFGFTLIEILVTISLIGVLSSIGIASYIEFSRRQLVLQTARKIVEDIRLAQSLAANNQKPEGCLGTLNGYTFRFDSSLPASLNYSINIKCSGGVDGVKTTNPYRTGSLPPDFTHNGFDKIFFNVLNQGTTCTPDTDPCQLTLSGNSFSQIISVGTGGVIKVEEE